MTQIHQAHTRPDTSQSSCSALVYPSLPAYVPNFLMKNLNHLRIDTYIHYVPNTASTYTPKEPYTHLIGLSYVVLYVLIIAYADQTGQVRSS